MKQGIQGAGWVLLPTQDVPLIYAWIKDTLGLPVLKWDGKGVAQFDLSQGMILELTPWSRRDTSAPKRFFNRDSALVLRVYGVDAIRAELEAKGVPFISDMIEIPNGRLCFFHDPEGHVYAIQERGAESDSPEDVEARARWAAQG